MIAHSQDIPGAPYLLIGCETSGAIRDAMRQAGINAYSCDLLPSDEPSPFHIQGDVFAVLASHAWDAGIFHPPCTYLSSSGLHWNGRVPGRTEKTEAAIAFARRLMEVDLPHVAVENPIGCLSTRVRKPDQIIQPYQFGDDASKATCLWLRGLPKLAPTGYYPPRIAKHKGKLVKRWGNQTDSGQNKLPPSADRWKQRSKTYPGIAAATAQQWAPVLLSK